MSEAVSDTDRLHELGLRLGGRYLIERELGRGGMGTVYLARDTRLDRPVALKVLPAEFAASPTLRERFLRETRTAASFSHPNIVPVYAVEESEDLVAFAMAYVEGESLADRVKRTGAFGVRDTVRLLQDVGYALAYAHGRGVVHRDIKPDNIMIERATGRAMVMDFGIARSIAAPSDKATPEGLTRVGEIVGTPEYMSPEQATADQVDGRSDLYSLGLTAHFAVTGMPAISGDTTGQILTRQITMPLPPIHTQRPDLPPPLAAAIDRCVVKDPNGRFESAEALVEALDIAQLAAPEIPVPIRLFAQEAGTLSMVLVFSALLTFFMFRGMGEDDSLGDILLPLVMLFSVLLTRVLQAMREVARLGAGGFSAVEVHRGLQAVVAEREVRRAELKADGVVREARRRTVIASIFQLGVAAVMFRAAMSFRHPRPSGGYDVELPGTMLVFGSMILFGIGLALLMRSPFSMPIGERLFRLVWLGPVGRLFVRGSGLKGSPTAVAGHAMVPRVEMPRAAAGSIPAVGESRIAQLESRVSDLEHWRKSAQDKRTG